MTKHAFLSASSSHRWLKCPIAPTLESKIPQLSSVYAQEGTFAHNLLAHCLQEGRDAESYANREITFDDDTRVVDTEMASSVQMVLEYARSFSGEFLSETEVPLEPFTTEKGATGTADIIIIEDNHWVIADFKYGSGVAVSPENNTKLMLYACGALHKYGDIFGEPQTLTLTIIQPRIRTGNPLQEWKITTQELRDKCRHFPERGLRALQLKGQRSISTDSYGVDAEACRFCRAKARLKKRLSRHVLLSTTENPQHLNDIDLSKAYSSLSLIKQYAKALEDEVFDRLNSGQEITGYQLVEGRKGNRVFKDEEKATEYLTSVLGDKAHCPAIS